MVYKVSKCALASCDPAAGKLKKAPMLCNFSKYRDRFSHLVLFPKIISRYKNNAATSVSEIGTAPHQHL